ncbi:sugar transferase [Methanocella sp. CWC-04]|uniref:Sugar transferase n=1 Tax=Methanooceanicella nereidis TaxID=2052831 RepID=A0AAP2RCM9_9EURY|nr:glycosyltransferase [Methanocella sp. CWC-04]MCD1294185.1 sugar transferase [Methanocella sp. CWC-04]
MKKKTNVCVIGPSKKFLSGISYYNIRLANCLSSSYSVSVLCFRNLLPRFLFPGSKHVGKDLSDVEYDSSVTLFDGMDYNNPVTWYRASKFLKREKPDVIIMQWWTSSVAHMHLLISLINSIRVRSKVIVEFHEVVDPLEESILPIKIYSRIMGRLLVKRADMYVTHSESDKKLIAAKYRIPCDRIHVVPLGLFDHHINGMSKEESRQNLGLNGEYVILSFGLIRPYKGIPYLVKAFGELPEEVAKRSRLLIVGEIWEDRESVENAIASSRYVDRITLIDKYIPDSEVSLYFSASDVVVLPYLRASQSAVAHLAMSFKKPIIVSKVGGLQESMSEYDGTYFIPPADDSAIKDAIVRIYNEKPGEFEPPKRGWDDIMDKYAEIISKII